MSARLKNLFIVIGASLAMWVAVIQTGSAAYGLIKGSTVDSMTTASLR
jgi:hypothetical protein